MPIFHNLEGVKKFKFENKNHPLSHQPKMMAQILFCFFQI